MTGIFNGSWHLLQVPVTKQASSAKSGGGAAKAETVASYRKCILLFKALSDRRDRPWPASEAKQRAQAIPLAPVMLWGYNGPLPEMLSQQVYEIWVSIS